jgi:acyl-[acyl-carrier-protein]-phospholipid O-acyltransferase/long-chain-fatty-acid--[acyl-carrier-protein] ligase
MERLNLEVDAELVYLEDLKDAPTRLDKAIGGAQAYALPAGLLLRTLGLDRLAADDVMTVVFTSGSTGDPKGAMLTYANIASNAAAVDEVIHLRPSDVLVGVLPFFHSFGYTVTLWTALTADVAAAYHVNPLEAQAVGRLCRQRQGTILLGTPMFFRTYARRCDEDDFATLEVVVAGGERLIPDVGDAFAAKFGIRPVEGYGTTETSPMVASNVPPARAPGDPALSAREGTVGRPMPGVDLKVVDRETGEDLGPGMEGVLWVRGPNVMKGYLNRPEATAQAIRDGWYVTGDVATIDADGFARIVGRESRFAKIGGEMVPHLAVEEAITALVGVDEEGGQRAVVVSAPDPHTGERLVVVHTPLEQTPAEIVRALADAGLPKLFIPAPNAFVQVEQLPTIGTGKLDIKRTNQIALEAIVRRPLAGAREIPRP